MPRLCSVQCCDRNSSVRGLCEAHYMRLRKGLFLDSPIRPQRQSCDIDGCTRKHIAMGLCVLHYRRMRKGANMTAPALVHGPDGRRFFSRVTFPDSGCWEWTARLNRAGYGVFAFKGENRLAHRVAYLWLVGDIPPGLALDHLCSTPRCVNPSHLEPVTWSENARREADRKRNAKDVDSG